MDPLEDPRCLVTTESVMIDGANGVCHEARTQHGQAPGLAAIGLGVLALAWLGWFFARWGSPRARVIVLLSIGIVGALYGGAALLTLRADRPAVRDQSALEAERLHDRVRAFARSRGGALLRTKRCVACEPIVRLAISDLPGPAPVDVYPDALERGCHERAGALSCGTP